MTTEAHTPDEIRIVLRPLASPLPLGLLGLGGGTVALAALQLSWVPPAQSYLVAIAVLVVAAAPQLLAALFGFLSRDPVAATGMGTLAAAWTAIGVLTLVGSPPLTRRPVLGLLLIYLAAAVLVSAVVAAGGKVLVALVFTVAAVRFGLTGIAALSGGPVWLAAAGLVGLVLGVLALYTALATELESARHRTVLPTLRYGSARDALGGGMALRREAGVREQL